MVLTFVFAGLSDLETAAEFAKLLSSNHTLWAGRPGSSEPGAGRLWHRALGFSQASSTRFSPLLPPPPRSQRHAARTTCGRGAGGRTSDPGMDGRHQWPRGKQESPGAHGPSAAAGGARRRPHARWPPPLRARGSALRLGAK